MVNTTITTINTHGCVYTHFGDDFDNVVALEVLRRHGATFKVKRCPAGKAPSGEIWVDVCGPNPEEAILVIDHHNGEARNALEVLRKLGFGVPDQAVEVADTEGKPRATDYRSCLSLLRYLPPSKVWEMAKAGLLLDSLSDKQIEEYELTEARNKQQEIVKTAIEKLRQYAVNDDVVIATENVLGGSFIAYELGYTMFAVTTPHKSGGVTFAVNSSEKLSDEVVEFVKSHGAFVPPHGKMAVLGGFKNPESRVEGETVETFSAKLRKLLIA
ncbi:MAG: hypothetical protein HQ538_03870 [Parcubacteria group bacterium]|nr:hypothetical protein [Parcubacteria group bacterium]